MTSDLSALEARLREGLAKFDLRLFPGSYFNVEGTCVCALGASIAYAAKTPDEIRRALAGDIEEAAARAVNHGATVDDMARLEAGFEGYCTSDESHPFYVLGQKLRAEALADYFQRAGSDAPAVTP